MHGDIDLSNPPGRRIGALALIRNEDGAVLMVKPSYKNGCILPGGGAHGDEPAHVACAREVAEETGLTHFEPGRLLLIDYIPRNETNGVTEGYNFVFDGGIMPSTASVKLPMPSDGEEPELIGYRWVQPHELNTCTEPHQESRVRKALSVLDVFGPAQYLCEGKSATANYR